MGWLILIQSPLVITDKEGFVQLFDVDLILYVLNRNITIVSPHIQDNHRTRSRKRSLQSVSLWLSPALPDSHPDDHDQGDNDDDDYDRDNDVMMISLRLC